MGLFSTDVSGIEKGLETLNKNVEDYTKEYTNQYKIENEERDRVNISLKEYQEMKNKIKTLEKIIDGKNEFIDKLVNEYLTFARNNGVEPEITGKEVEDCKTMEIHHYTDIYVPPFHICKW